MMEWQRRVVRVAPAPLPRSLRTVKLAPARCRIRQEDHARDGGEAMATASLLPMVLPLRRTVRHRLMCRPVFGKVRGIAMQPQRLVQSLTVGSRLSSQTMHIKDATLPLHPLTWVSDLLDLLVLMALTVVSTHPMVTATVVAVMSRLQLITGIMVMKQEMAKVAVTRMWSPRTVNLLLTTVPTLDTATGLRTATTLGKMRLILLRIVDLVTPTLVMAGTVRRVQVTPMVEVAVVRAPTTPLVMQSTLLRMAMVMARTTLVVVSTMQNTIQVVVAAVAAVAAAVAWKLTLALITENIMLAMVHIRATGLRTTTMLRIPVRTVDMVIPKAAIAAMVVRLRAMVAAAAAVVVVLVISATTLLAIQSMLPRMGTITARNTVAMAQYSIQLLVVLVVLVVAVSTTHTISMRLDTVMVNTVILWTTVHPMVLVVFVVMQCVTGDGGAGCGCEVMSTLLLQAAVLILFVRWWQR